ncbi:tRNA modification GTPase MnmE [uncultured Desulfatiglans sp.]|nr:tRNA modification GTPase MnmE [uncultured Desulfatiglans sp.]
MIATPDPAANDTISAIATPAGPGGIGIVRVSGPAAHAIVGGLFRPRHATARWSPQRLYYGHIIDPETREPLDEVLVSFMPSPHSYTREDYAEINSHGGYVLLSKVLRLTVEAGARPARPGEFTLRAYLNGRIDLTQAEAVMDLIQSRSEQGLVMASRQIQGRLRNEIASLREAAVAVLAQVESAIDFMEEEDTGFDPLDLLKAVRDGLLQPIERLLAAHRRRVWVDGVGTVLAGRVNAGKSSLLNRLTDEDRAIVTPSPGTTRDVIETVLNLDGVPLRLMDTAGFRRARNPAERIGLEHSRRRLGEADLILMVIDQSRPLASDDLELLDYCKGRNHLVILNKIDLPPRIGRAGEERLAACQTVRVSALTGEGIEELHQAIKDRVLSSERGGVCSDVAPNLRHKQALENAAAAFRRALQGIQSGDPSEIVAFELQTGLDALGGIIGEVPHEAVLDEIFSRFCIGK